MVGSATELLDLCPPDHTDGVVAPGELHLPNLSPGEWGRVELENAAMNVDAIILSVLSSWV